MFSNKVAYDVGFGRLQLGAAAARHSLCFETPYPHLLSSLRFISIQIGSSRQSTPQLQITKPKDPSPLTTALQTPQSSAAAAAVTDDHDGKVSSRVVAWGDLRLLQSVVLCSLQRVSVQPRPGIAWLVVKYDDIRAAARQFHAATVGRRCGKHPAGCATRPDCLSAHSARPLRRMPRPQHHNRRVPCKFYQQGSCAFGDGCRFSHDGPGGAAPVASSGGGGGAAGGREVRGLGRVADRTIDAHAAA